MAFRNSCLQRFTVPAQLQTGSTTISGPLLILPTEILLRILALAEPIEAVCLALTCKHLLQASAKVEISIPIKAMHMHTHPFTCNPIYQNIWGFVPKVGREVLLPFDYDGDDYDGNDYSGNNYSGNNYDGDDYDDDADDDYDDYYDYDDYDDDDDDEDLSGYVRDETYGLCFHYVLDQTTGQQPAAVVSLRGSLYHMLMCIMTDSGEAVAIQQFFEQYDDMCPDCDWGASHDWQGFLAEYQRIARLCLFAVTTMKCFALSLCRFYFFDVDGVPFRRLENNVSSRCYEKLMADIKKFVEFLF